MEPSWWSVNFPQSLTLQKWLALHCIFMLILRTRSCGVWSYPLVHSIDAKVLTRYDWFRYLKLSTQYCCVSTEFGLFLESGKSKNGAFAIRDFTLWYLIFHNGILKILDLVFMSGDPVDPGSWIVVSWDLGDFVSWIFVVSWDPGDLGSWIFVFREILEISYPEFLLPRGILEILDPKFLLCLGISGILDPD